MTPKQKAIELYDKFHVWDTMAHQEVKKMALIALDQILEVCDVDYFTDEKYEGEYFSDYEFFMDVEQELLKL
jgi:hypothetical protein